MAENVTPKSAMAGSGTQPGESAPLRVLILIRSLNIGGAEVKLTTFLKRIDTRAFKPVLAVFYGGALMPDARAIPGVRVINCRKRSRWDFVYLIRVIRIAHRLKPQIIHGDMPLGMIAAGIVGILVRPARVIFAVQGSNNIRSNNAGFAGRLSLYLAALLSRRANLAIASSRGGRDYYTSVGFRPARWVVVATGIDVTEFQRNLQGGEKVRRSLGISQSAKVLGIAARLDPVKDYPTFLRAAAIVRNLEPSLAVLCVGGGPDGYFKELRALSESLGLTSAVKWLGVRRDMPDIYSAMDVCVSCSWCGESNPLVIAEAMACGTPCVCTDVPDTKWMVGECGLVVPPREPGQLAAATMEMLARIASPESATAIRRANRTAALERFTLHRYTTSMEEAFRNVVGS